MMRTFKSSFVTRLAIVPAILLAAASLSFAQTQGTKSQSSAKENSKQSQSDVSQSQSSSRGSGLSQQRLSQEVNHELVMLPWYSVYDNLQYKVNGSEVTLQGEVLN